MWGPGVRWVLAVTTRYPRLRGLAYGADICARVTRALFRASDGSRVSAVVNTTGGGDAIVLTPNTPLDANTKYTFVATNGVTFVPSATALLSRSTFEPARHAGVPRPAWMQQTFAF